MKKIEDRLFFLGLFFLLLLPALDPDLGWQLRCGEIIVKGQGFCSQNRFSSLLANYHWPNHHWLYQVVLFLVWKGFGFWGLTVLGAMVSTLIFYFFNLAIKNWQLEKKWAILLTLFLGWGVFLFGIRSQLLGIFYFNLILLYLFRKEAFSDYYLPLIFFFWANSHGSVVLGLVLLAFFSLKELYSSSSSKVEASTESRRLALSLSKGSRQARTIKKHLLMITICFLVTLINPFGLKIYQEAWRHFAQVPLDQLIAEWVPPLAWQRFLVLLSSLVLFFFIKKSLWPLLVSFVFLALKARRNLPFFFILFFALFLTSSKIKEIFKVWLKKNNLREDFLVLTSLIVLFGGVFIRLPKTIKTNSSFENFCQASKVSYPLEAVSFLKKQKGKGNLFNRYEWGGFLIWQLPEYKVFVDGRMPAWPAHRSFSEGGSISQTISPYTIYLETLQTRPGWQETLKKYNINWILISPGTFMDFKLAPDPEKFGWQEAYRDKISVVYKRKER